MVLTLIECWFTTKPPSDISKSFIFNDLYRKQLKHCLYIIGQSSVLPQWKTKQKKSLNIHRLFSRKYVQKKHFFLLLIFLLPRDHQNHSSVAGSDLIPDSKFLEWKEFQQGLKSSSFQESRFPWKGWMESQQPFCPSPIGCNSILDQQWGLLVPISW